MGPMSLNYVPVFIMVLIVLFPQTYTQKQPHQKIDQVEIMYGSTIRVKASAFNYFLHSHLVNYPQGSGYQSVTGFPSDNDYNSLWTVREGFGESVKTYQQKVKCGDRIRLEHTLTKRKLHSEQIYQSIISKNQEVSAYKAGNSNQNDDWVIKCLQKKQGEVLKGDDNFELAHHLTGKKMKMSKYYQYTYSNWEDCPFHGQLEISATDKSTRQTQFKIVGGIFFREAPIQSDQQNPNGKAPTDDQL